jgi:3-oxoacyl-(acyl-carrier-protein) synthase
MLLNTDASPDHLCELAGICISHHPDHVRLKQQVEKMLQEAELSWTDLSAVMTGINGNNSNDEPYHHLVRELFPDLPHLHYKHIFGENHTSSALGIYAAAHCLKRGVTPQFMYAEQPASPCSSPQNILFVNVTNSGDYSFVLLKK